MRRWWTEWEVWLLTFLVATTYLVRLTDVPLTGEESRRAQVSREMLQRSDWIVPRQQGEPFLSRPPVQNWLIALVAMARGDVDVLALRLPSVLATVLEVILIYGYCRTFLSRLGAFCAAAVFPSMGYVVQMAWQGETEPVYTLLVSGSLLLWRWADVLEKPPLWGWCAGYGLAALGMLTKGPQAPVYFAGGVGLFLCVSGRWRSLLQWPHLVGMAVFLVGWAAWEIPFWQRAGTADAWTMFVGDVAMRFDDRRWLVFAKHLVTFPLEVALCMLPWSALLVAYARREFRQTLGPARQHVVMLVCSAGFAFLTCWLVAGAKNRYYSPLYPCFAPLIGLVVQRCYESATTAPWANLWERYLKGVGVTILVIAAWVAVATLLNLGPSRGAQPPIFALVYVLASVALGVLAFRASIRRQLRDYRTGILAVAAFIPLSFIGVVFNIMVATKNPVAENIAQLRQRLPEGTRLVSIGVLNHTFTYYWAEPIELVRCPQPGPARDADWTYFCVNDGPERAACDFPCEQVALISCEPFVSPHPKRKVFVGRRLPSEAGEPRPAATP